MPYLFDTNALSESLRKRPNPDYLSWLCQVPAEHQFSSIVVVAELLAGAYESADPEKWLQRIESDVLPALTILEFDYNCAREFGKLRAFMRRLGRPIGDIDTQVAASALAYDLTLVSANSRHFALVPDLKLRPFRPGAN